MKRYTLLYMVMTVVLGLRAEDNTSLYDQVHGDGQGADELLSPKWWQDLVFASQEAKRIIDLTGLMAAAQVFVNGREAGTVWCSPWTLDITPYVKKGKNQLEIRVANSLWNRLVGDANKPEADRLMRQNYPLAKPDDRLTPSGLTGAVRIISQRP